MEEAVTILDVLAVDLCALQILDYVPLRDLVRSERVSRQWQLTVRKYLRGTNLTLLDSSVVDLFQLLEGDHRRINIPANRYSLSCLSKTVKKLGPSIVKVITHQYSDKYFKIIAWACPDLQNIQFCNINGQAFPMNTIKKFEKLNQISFFMVHEMSECALGMLLQNVNCKKLEIHENNAISFRFLTFIEPFSLTSLSLKKCKFLMTDLASQICYLQNITSLELEFYSMAVFKDMHLVLNGLPKLKYLSLTKYKYELDMEPRAELIESFSQLVNLKRLIMSHNESVSKPLLEAVARGCKKLEYLDVKGSIKMEARTLAALCTIPSPLVIAFSFPYVYHLNYSSADDFNKLVAAAKNVPLFRELEDLGLKLMWSDVVGVFALAPVTGARAKTTQLKLGCVGSQAGSFQHELRLYLEYQNPGELISPKHNTFDPFSESLNLWVQRELNRNRHQ